MIAGLGNKSIRHLAELYPDPTEVFNCSHSRLCELFGKHTGIIKAIEQKTTVAAAEKSAKELERYGIKALFFTESDYPQRLNQPGCEDAPVLLYMLGNCNLNATHSVAVVGTRKATDYGRTTTARLVREMSSKDILIVSGLAYGIDTEAHRTAVDTGLPTVGVLGHGLDQLYPPQNRQLAERMLAQGGALLTEYPFGTAISGANFPARNRIIAALADATVVVEAAERGGALITANMASGYNREVFAVPGRVGDPYSAGCNNLIVNNRAILIRNAGDLLFQMGWEDHRDCPDPKVKQQELFTTLSGNEQSVVGALRDGRELTMDEIVAKCGLPLPKIASLLLDLELKNVIRCLPGKLYKLV